MMVTSLLLYSLAFACFAAANSVCLADLKDAAESPPDDKQDALVVIVQGAGGQAEFASQFSQWAQRWRDTAESSGAGVVEIGGDADVDRSVQEASDKARLRDALSQAKIGDHQRIWLVLLGHGTFDGRAAKFNLEGPDVSAGELKTWLDELQLPAAVAVCSSCSGPFVPELSAPNRVVITATNSGDETNFSRFGDYLSAAIGDPEADLDKDGSPSLWEAFLAAGRRTAAYYEDNGLLATEHSLCDDNGDQRGVQSDWFHGLHPVQRPAEGEIDGDAAAMWRLLTSRADEGLNSEQLAERDRLEREILALRRTIGAKRPSDAQLAQAEKLLLELANLYHDSERSNQKPTAPDSAGVVEDGASAAESDE